MDNSLVFTTGCEYKFVKEFDHNVMYVEYETVSGKYKRQRFDLVGDAVYVIDGHRLAYFSYISDPPKGVELDIKRICYREEPCSTIIGGKMFIPTRIEFDTVIHVPKESPNAALDRVKMINQQIARDTLDSAYGVVSRDWADSARYIHMQRSRCSGKTLWLSSVTSFDDNPMRMLREEYLKAIGREEDEKLGRWLKQPPTKINLPRHEFISDDLEDCEKGVPNTKLVGTEQLYIKDTTTGEFTRFDGIKEITSTAPDGYFDTDMVITKEEMQYCLNDVAVTERIFKEEKVMKFDSCKPTIKNVIFNDPATIVMWSDGTKTVVKCGEDDTFDPEKGVAMCCMKKLLGTNKTGSNYLDKVQKYFDSYIEEAVNNVFIGEILGSIFGSKKKPSNSKDIPPDVTVEKEFDAVTSDDWTAVPADENQVAEENGE